ncbi:MAG: ribose 5-phosphate isomerase B [Defluviitaleaceae bacterium]|nr:ribose 5-phosphate isomerase B [Defluviitaleaceae bacterium]MCL2836488.1 ribose 5-phosphate isomerase B [Defluviitaleaceae bacterium]
MRIALGCDHTALDMKRFVKAHLEKKGLDVELFIPDENDENHDYPVFAERVANAVGNGACDAGVLICGTGAGMCIAANKVNGVRAVNCSEAFTARLAKEHNNTNVICLGARVIAPEMAVMIVDAWLDARFEDGGRHARRVALFGDIERNNRG